MNEVVIAILKEWKGDQFKWITQVTNLQTEFNQSFLRQKGWKDESEN